MIKKVCVFVFKKTMRGYEFLTLRTDGDNYGIDIWQPITGHLEDKENYIEAAKRKVLEETGIKSILRITDPELEQEFTSKNGKKYVERTFGFEVSSDVEKIEFSKEHRSYSWSNKETAQALIHWDSNKVSLSQIYDKIKS